MRLRRTLAALLVLLSVAATAHVARAFLQPVSSPERVSAQVRWLNENGGMAWSTARCAQSAALLYEWAERSEYARPFVADPGSRSNAVVTVDLDDAVSAKQVIAALRENGIVDTSGYRKLGRNQLRIGVFPSVEPSDVAALTACIDYVVEHL